MKKYIILEIIPSSSYVEKGEVLQLSALKVENFKLLGRFDKRIVLNKIPFPELEKLVDYDKESFDYKSTSKEIMQDFEKWSSGYSLLIINNSYTENYLNYYGIKNPKKSVFALLNLTFHENVFEDVLNKYNLKPTNYIVDLLFEALIYEENNKNTGKLTF